MPAMQLSICIPTFNRADILAISLRSLTSDPFFLRNEDVEIVISDNASSDHTREIGALFAEQFRGRIRYFRNDENLGDLNIEIAARHGRGKYLKLINDTVLWKDGALETLYNLVSLHEVNKPVIFMLNGCKTTAKSEVMVTNLNDLVRTVSFYMGWLGVFGIWRDQIDAMPDFSRRIETRLVQVDVLLRLIAGGKSAIICNRICFKVQEPGRKGGYCLAEIFGRHYLQLLSEYIGFLDHDTFRDEKKAVLIDHILLYHFHPEHDFYLHPLEEILDENYRDESYYVPTIDKARKQWIQYLNRRMEKFELTGWKNWMHHFWIKFILRIKPNHQKSVAKKWRVSNSHNDTSAGNPFDISKVRVGLRSYGRLNVHAWGATNEFLEIGSYVSIADNVQFLLGGNHEQQTLSTYPFKTKLLNQMNEAQTKGPIIVKDDVWIGYGAMVLSGVTLHQGAVIAAGAVVTSDVPAYAVVAGNPAKIVKYRFSDNLIEQLTQYPLADLSKEAVWSRPDLITLKITEENVQKIIQGLNIRVRHK